MQSCLLLPFQVVFPHLEKQLGLGTFAKAKLTACMLAKSLKNGGRHAELDRLHVVGGSWHGWRQRLCSWLLGGHGFPVNARRLTDSDRVQACLHVIALGPGDYPG